MIYLGKDQIGITQQLTLPSFFNHLESGTLVNNGASSLLEIPLNTITFPKGILIYSNGFNLTSAKADKPLLGAYCALYIKGTEDLVLSSDHVYYLAAFSSYFINWGGDTNSKYPTKRDSRTESRGIYYFRPSNQAFAIRGFGTGDYDFKYNITYNWIAWD